MKIKIVYVVNDKTVTRYYQDEESAYQDLGKKIKAGFKSILIERC